MDEIPEIKIDGNINVIFKTGKLDGVNHDEQSSSKPCTDIALIDTRKLDSETNGNMDIGSLESLSRSTLRFNVPADFTAVYIAPNPPPPRSAGSSSSAGGATDPFHESSSNSFMFKHSAAYTDHVSKIRHALSSRRERRNAISFNRPFDINKIDERRLMHAVRLEEEPLVLSLLQNGVNASSVDSRLRTPLHHAVVKGNVNIVKTLLQYGAAVNKKDVLGNIPLHLAAFRSQAAVIKLLLQAGSNVNTVDCFDRSPITIARSRLHTLHGQMDCPNTKLRMHVQQILDMMKIHFTESGTETSEIEGLCMRLSLTSTRDEIDVIGSLIDNLTGLKVDT